MLAAAGVLGGVKRKVGVADEGVGAGPARIADGDADRGADRHLVAFDHVRPRDLLDQRPGKRFEQADVDRPGQHRLELVAAEAADLAVIAHHRLQAVGDLAKQRVADRMAERVVDVLEPIEIDQEQRAALLAVRGIAQRFVERLPHHRAVRQAGQRIEAGEARDLLFGAALLGKVGADAAEAEEAAALVEDRVARKRPVDVLLARRADDHVGEGEARGQVEAERLALLERFRAVVDRKQIGELAAEQRFGLALEIVGELPRHVGQGAERVGFPEPAAAAVLELVDEVERLLRLPFERRGASRPREQRLLGDQRRCRRPSSSASTSIAKVTAGLLEKSEVVATATKALTIASGGDGTDDDRAHEEARRHGNGDKGGDRRAGASRAATLAIVHKMPVAAR